jgi:hypothetical protein
LGKIALFLLPQRAIFRRVLPFRALYFFESLCFEKPNSSVLAAKKVPLGPKRRARFLACGIMEEE